jgi:DNA-binding SARP family transcriptional activator
MTIDERIEALTQSVKLLFEMHQDNEKRYERMFERLTRIAPIQERIRGLEDGQQDEGSPL